MTIECVRLNPVMTSGNAPSGRVFASSYADEYNLPFYGFDGKSNATSWMDKTKWGPNGVKGWLAYEFNESTKVNAYSISNVKIPNWGNRSPKEWTFEGSYDEVTWVILDKRHGETDWSLGEIRHYTFNNSTPYKMYRLNITANNGGDYSVVGELEFYFLPPYRRHLIKSSNKIQNLLDGNWNDLGVITPTKIDFETHGISDLSIIPKEKLDELIKPWSILTWTDNVEATKATLDYNYEQYQSKWLEITTDPFSPMEKLNQEEEFEVLTWSDLEETPKLELTVPDKIVRYLVSKDKYSYEVYRDSKWISIDKSNVLTKGMTKIELESIPQEVWSEWFESEAHKNSFNILIGMYSGIPNIPLLRKIEIEFEENEKPIIIDAELVPDDIHNEYAVLNANVKDMEGDKISFRVLIKKAGGEFIQVSPLTGWYNRLGYEEFITQAYNYPYFNPGDNQIKLVVKDERGLESEWVGNVLLSNTDPTVTIIYDDTQMTATVGDDDEDMVAYRLFINGELIFDWTEFKESPTTFNYLFDSNILLFGEDNTIRLEVKDTHGGSTEEEFKVTGTYRGLMFKNEQGEYFVDDRGNILMDLLLQDHVLIGGQTSPTSKVILENRNGFPIKNTTIAPLEKEFTPNAWVEISETEMPFVPKDIINIKGIMNNLDTKDFYVRVRSTREASTGNYFYIQGKSSPIE